MTLSSSGPNAPTKVGKACQFRQPSRKGSSSSVSSSRPSSAAPSRCASPFSTVNGLITPISSRPNSPLGNRTTFQNSRRTNSHSSTFTSLIAPLSPALSTASSDMSSSMDLESFKLPRSTVTWDCASAIVSNQKKQTSYEKPTYSPGTKFDSNGVPIPGTGTVISYGKLQTKTVTMTVTTTIASTEILHPGDEGYEASIERQQIQEEERQLKASMQMSPHVKTELQNDDEQDEKHYIDDNSNSSWPSGDPSIAEHEAFHRLHHNSTQASMPIKRS